MAAHVTNKEYPFSKDMYVNNFQMVGNESMTETVVKLQLVPILIVKVLYISIATHVTKQGIYQLICIL